MMIAFAKADSEMIVNGLAGMAYLLAVVILFI